MFIVNFICFYILCLYKGDSDKVMVYGEILYVFFKIFERISILIIRSIGLKYEY